MLTSFEHQKVSDFLGAEFALRKQRNKSYSLRAFARDLDLSPSRLSEVLKGEQGLSEKSADTIAVKLKLKPRVREFWKDLILAESSRSGKVRELAQARLEEKRKEERFRVLREDQFRVVSDWYHSAILEAVALEEFQKQSAEQMETWIAEKIGIPRSLATESLARLIQLGLLKREKSGRLTSYTEPFGAFPETPSAYIRKFHRQVLEMHITSVLEDPMDERELISMILALPKARLGEFRTEMRKFIMEFWQRVENEPRDQIYSFSVQLCPVKKRSRK
ncbi:MAG: TIGR02147 family protein [Bdellovibrionota bacterium]